MIHKLKFIGIDTSITSFNLRWHVSFNQIDSCRFKLQLLNPKEICLTDSDELKTVKKKQEISQKFILIWLHWTLDI